MNPSPPNSREPDPGSGADQTPHQTLGESPTLGEHFGKALLKAQRRRPFSSYMLLAIPVILCLIAPLFWRSNTPLGFATLLTVLFVFLGIVLMCALLDIFEIGRRQFSDNRESFRSTLGDDAFIQKLKEHVRKPENK